MTIDKFFDRLSKHKIVFDRGGVYMNYYSIIAISLILVKSFNVTKWWAYLIFIFTVFIFRYLAGFIDKKYILKKEQKKYADQNPAITELNNKLDIIIKKLS